MPRPPHGTATATRARSGTKRTTSPAVRASPIVWQGASLDGQYFFRVSRMASGLTFSYAPIGTTVTLAFKPITAPAVWEQLASAELMVLLGAAGTMPGTSLANRSIPRTSANAIPNGAATGNTGTARRRVGSRVSVNRSTAAAAN